MKRLIFIFVILTFTLSVVQPQELGTDLEIETESKLNIIRAHSGCECDTQCNYDSGTYNDTCEESNAGYISCKNSSCSVEFCPTDEIFSYSSWRCESFPSGLKPRWIGTYALCDCPAGSGRDNYRDVCLPCSARESRGLQSYCYCQGLVLDERTNECKKCPDNTINNGENCKCIDPRTFWSDSEFSCKECPGILVPWEHKQPQGLEGDYECRCEAENKVFIQRTGTCEICPPDSFSYRPKYKKPFTSCGCLGNKLYNHRRNMCEGRKLKHL